MLAKFKKSKKRNSYSTLLFSIMIFLLISGTVGFLIISNWKISQKRTELNSKVEALKKEIGILEKKNQELRVGISQISLEKEARERLGLKKPSEEVVAILPPEEKEKEQPKEKNFWQKFLEKIGF